jgi:hypothetical protein
MKAIVKEYQICGICDRVCRMAGLMISSSRVNPQERAITRAGEGGGWKSVAFVVEVSSKAQQPLYWLLSWVI